MARAFRSPATGGSAGDGGRQGDYCLGQDAPVHHSLDILDFSAPEWGLLMTSTEDMWTSGREVAGCLCRIQLQDLLDGMTLSAPPGLLA